MKQNISIMDEEAEAVGGGGKEAMNMIIITYTPIQSSIIGINKYVCICIFDNKSIKCLLMINHK